MHLGKKELILNLRFWNNILTNYNPKVHLDLANIFLITSCSILFSRNQKGIQQIARSQLKKKSWRGAHSPQTPPLSAQANHSLMSRPDLRLRMPIKKPISEQNELSK